MRHLFITSLHNLFDKLHLKNKWSGHFMQLLQNANKISPCTLTITIYRKWIIFSHSKPSDESCLEKEVKAQISFHQLTSDNLN